MFDASDLPARIAARSRALTATELGIKRYRRSARFSQLAIVAAREAVADAGVDSRSRPIGRGRDQQRHRGRLRDRAERAGLASGGSREVSAYYVPSMITNMAAARSPSTTSSTAPSTPARWPARAARTRCWRPAMDHVGAADVVIAGRRLGITPACSRACQDGSDVRAQRRARARQPAVRRRSRRLRIRRGRCRDGGRSAEHAAQRGARIYGDRRRCPHRRRLSRQRARAIGRLRGARDLTGAPGRRGSAGGA